MPLSEEQSRKVKNEAIPDWAQGLYYNSGLFTEVLVYHDEESIYFEHRGRESAVVRFTFEMVELMTPSSLLALPLLQSSNPRPSRR